VRQHVPQQVRQMRDATRDSVKTATFADQQK